MSFLKISPSRAQTGGPYARQSEIRVLNRGLTRVTQGLNSFPSQLGTANREFPWPPSWGQEAALHWGTTRLFGTWRRRRQFSTTPFLLSHTSFPLSSSLRALKKQKRALKHSWFPTAKLGLGEQHPREGRLKPPRIAHSAQTSPLFLGSPPRETVFTPRTFVARSHHSRGSEIYFGPQKKPPGSLEHF